MTHKAIDQSLSEKLHAIAARRGGGVPLHGRLFAQWLHFAFPHECPYPSVLESATALSASQWLDGRSTASSEERSHHVASASAAGPEAADFEIDGRWSDHEVLPMHRQPHASFFQMGGGAMRVVMQFVALLVAVRSALAAWQASETMRESKAKKDDGFVSELPELKGLLRTVGAIRPQQGI